VGTTHGGGEVGDAERKAELVNKGQSRDGDGSRPAILLALTARSTAVALIDCPECGRQISTTAEACPGCGHPNRPTAASAGPKCYSCPATATTKCQKCNAPSCVPHVEGVTINLDNIRELRCAGCVSAANGSKTFHGVMIVVVLLIAFVVMAFGFYLTRH
jgi:hypothetical protein